MAHLLFIVSLVGLRGAYGLASVSDLGLMQTSREIPSRLASVRPRGGKLRRDRGRGLFMFADVPIYPHTSDGDLEDSDAPRSWILELAKDATDMELQNLIQELHSGQMTHPDQGEVPFLVVNITAYELMALLDKYPGRFRLAEEDVRDTLINDTIVADATLINGQSTYPWGIQSIKADLVRGRGVGVNVYVLDTGIRTTHAEFGGRAFAGVDVGATGSLTVCAPGSTTCAYDSHGHGTHCAGTVGSSTYGVADGATIWAMKVLADDGTGYVSWSIEAEQWILSSGFRPAVASLSLGGVGQSASHQDSLNELVNDGVTVVVAAGNSETDACTFTPAFVPSAITVGSYGGNSGSSSAMSWFSNYGPCIDVWAPGTSVTSLGKSSDTATQTMSGTSMACPHVSGLAAIMYEAYPSATGMTPGQRWELLTATNRTDWVTAIPSTPASVNLVAEAPPTASLTPSPTASSTPSPTASTAPPTAPVTAPTPPTGGISAVGDPHLTNMYGQRFDLYRTGVHVLLQIPRWVGPQGTFLRLEADARRMGACSELYFQALRISGIWTNRSDTLELFAKSVDKPSSMKWTRFGKVDLKVVNGRTREGLDYLNVFVRNIRNAGYSVGGLLGEDDHGDVSVLPKACARQLSLIERPSSLIASAAVASSA